MPLRTSDISSFRSAIPPRTQSSPALLPKTTAPSLAWPAGVLLVALYSLLAFAPPIAYTFGIKIPCCARTRSLKLAEQRTTTLFSITDARDPTGKITVSLLARPASVPLSALSSLLEFPPSLAYAFSATILRRARASLPWAWKCPAITQLGRKDTSGLGLSQLDPDESPTDPPHLDIPGSVIKSTERKRIRVGALDGRCKNLKSKITFDLSGLKALPHGNNVASDKPPDIPVLYFEKNGMRLNNAGEHKSKIKCDSRSNRFLLAFLGHQLMQAVDLTLYFCVLRIDPLLNQWPTTHRKVKNVTFQGEMVQGSKHQKRIQL